MIRVVTQQSENWCVMWKNGFAIKSERREGETYSCIRIFLFKYSKRCVKSTRCSNPHVSSFFRQFSHSGILSSCRARYNVLAKVSTSNSKQTNVQYSHSVSSILLQHLKLTRLQQTSRYFACVIFHEMQTLFSVTTTPGTIFIGTWKYMLLQ